MRNHGSPLTDRLEFSHLATVSSTTSLGPIDARAGLEIDDAFNTSAAVASHPVIGDWLVVTALGPANVSFDVGGDVIVVWPHSRYGSQPGNYYEYSTAATGAWRPVSSWDFDMVVTMGDTDDGGLVTGATTMESRARIASDGASFRGIGTGDRVLRARFSANPSIDLVMSLAPMSGIRMQKR